MSKKKCHFEVNYSNYECHKNFQKIQATLNIYDKLTTKHLPVLSLIETLWLSLELYFSMAHKNMALFYIPI